MCIESREGWNQTGGGGGCRFRGVGPMNTPLDFFLLDVEIGAVLFHLGVSLQ